MTFSKTIYAVMIAIPTFWGNSFFEV